MTRRTYTDADRVRALAALEANGGNASRAARDAGVPRPTLILWRDQAIAAAPDLSVSLTVSDAEKVTDWAQLYGEAARLGAEIITTNLKRYAGDGSPGAAMLLKPSELRDVAVVAGIAVDKHLDYRDGRKAGVVVDQSQHLVVPPGTTLADVERLEVSLRVAS